MGLPATQVLIAFGFGVTFVVTLIVLAIKFPHPTPFQYNIFRTILSLAAAGVAAMIPGFINIQVESSTGLLIRAGGAVAVFVVIFFFNPARLTAHSDVPPAKLPSGDPLPPEMQGAFVDVWQSLCALERAGNDLWRSVSDITLGAFAEQLRATEELITKHALFFSDDEYQSLRDILRAANFYLGGKVHLADIRNGRVVSDSLIDLAGPGERDAFVDPQVRRQIQQNRRWLTRYGNLLSAIRSRFHKVVAA